MKRGTTSRLWCWILPLQPVWASQNRPPGPNYYSKSLQTKSRPSITFWNGYLILKVIALLLYNWKCFKNGTWHFVCLGSRNGLVVLVYLWWIPCDGIFSHQSARWIYFAKKKCGTLLAGHAYTGIECECIWISLFKVPADFKAALKCIDFNPSSHVLHIHYMLDWSIRDWESTASL